MPNLPGVVVSFINAAPGGLSAERVVLFAGLGAGSTGVADQLERIDSVGKGLSWFGASQGADTVQEFFNSTRLRKDTELYAFGLIATGWTVHTDTVEFTGTTTAAGTDTFRKGPHVFNVSQISGADPTAQADAWTAAVTASGIPYTAGNVAGVGTLTSTYVGATENHVELTANLFAGEDGVAGGDIAITINVDATGEPASMSQAQKDELETLAGSVYWVQHQRGASWLADLESESQRAWDDRNVYGHIFQGVRTVDAATFVTFADQNKRRFSFAPQGNAVEYELPVGMQMVGTVVTERKEKGIPNPGLVNVVFRGMSGGTTAYTEQELQNILDAGGIPVVTNNGTVTASKMVSNRTENDLAQPDLSEQSIHGVLARRYLLEQTFLTVRGELGKTIIPDNLAVDGNTTSAANIFALMETLMVRMLTEHIIFAESEQAARDLVDSVTLTTDVNIPNGFDIRFSPLITKVTNTIDARAFAS